MANYLEYSSGYIAEKGAIGSTAGVGDASKIIQTDAGGKLDASFLPSGVMLQVKIVQASEALSAGDFVNIYWNTTDTAWRVRLADASVTDKQANAFVKAAVSSGGNASCYLEGVNDQVTGFTAVGGDVWLSATTPGAGTTTAVASGSGGISQRIGTILSATELDTEFSEPIQLA